MKKTIIYLIFSLVYLPAYCIAETIRTDSPDARMLRYPDVGKDMIVFVYAGDLWTVPKKGGFARRLSSVKGPELFPKFSPDGRMLAFSGNYDGNIDIYVIPSEGGEPLRLTHHPEDDYVVEWYPDGKNILFRSKMMSPVKRYNRFFKQSIKGGLPKPLPLRYGELASFSPEGRKMVFQFISRESRNWKRYRGGMASDLWIYDLKNNEPQKLTDFEGTDSLPMWHDNTIYFLSDRDKNRKLNIWAYDIKNKNFRQVTNFTDYDVKWPSLGPDSIVFEKGGNLYLLDLQSEIVKSVKIKVPADLPQIRPQLKNVSKKVGNYSLSPSAKRALFEARGEIFTVPAEHGSIRNLTRSSGIAERVPIWSPDGKHIAYFSDRTGQYELYIMNSAGTDEARQLTNNGTGFPNEAIWSGNSKKLAYSDKKGNLFFFDLKKNTHRLVDKDDWYAINTFSWSPYSHWLAYAKTSDNGQGVIMIYDSLNDKKYQLTSGYYNDSSPVFGPEGKILYFYSDRKFKPIYSDMDETWIYPNSTEIYAITLQKQTLSPIAPLSDEEDYKKGNNKEDKDNSNHKKETKDIKIDFQNIEKRVVKLPIDHGNFGKLSAVDGKLLYLRLPLTGKTDHKKPHGRLVYYDLKKRKETDVISDINSFKVSSEGKKVVYKSKNKYGIIDIAKGKKVGDGKIPVDKLEAWINPREEWSQIFNEAWRNMRDFFYDPGMHGVDWQAVKERYEILLPYVVDRADLNHVIGEMIGELNSSHTYVHGGDIKRKRKIPVGLLGCDFKLDRANNVFIIKKIYEGANWDAELRSPLKEPGINVREGDYILAVNGQKLDTKKDPWAAFQGLEGEVVTLTINSKPTFKGAEDIIIKPLSKDQESRIRYLSWIEDNRRKVEEKTNGRVGYIYVKNTGRAGQNELVRQFIPQRMKDGLIIDERFNAGGQIPDRFIELLNRPIYNYWARRDLRDLQTPYITHNGPKVMLINGWAGSGGDAFPYYFRKAGLGPLVGTRTMGGLIGIGDNPKLIDGGNVSVPSYAIWDTEGNWNIEGYGVKPDFEIENSLQLLPGDNDQQLEKAIEVIMKLLEDNPPKKPARPTYPDRSGKTN